MNLATKIIIRRDQDQTIKLISRFYIKPASGSMDLKKAKRNNDEIMQIDF